MTTSRLIVLVIFMLALGGVALVVIWADPFGDGARDSSASTTPVTPESTPSNDPLEEPVAGTTASGGPPAKRLFEVHAWSRGDGASLRRAVAAAAIDEVDFDWYHSRADGSLKAEGEDLALVRRAQSQGVRALMTITNRKDHKAPFDPDISAPILATAQSRSKHVDVLVDACLEKGYDGVDMDWEMMDPTDRDRFSEFVEELGDRLHAEDKLLSIAVFPKTSEPGDWDSQKSEDYKRLGAAVDEFKVMTYSFSGPWSEPGPQAPLEWTNEVLAFAQTQVAPRKIFMGVPFFGFAWHGGDAETFYARDIEKLQEKYLLETRRDRASGEAVTTWTDEKRGKHTAYYMDTRALNAKLDLLVKDNPKIAGIAIWVMGKEQAEFWDVIARQLAE